MDTIRNESMSKPALDTIDLVILCWRSLRRCRTNPLTGRNTTGSRAPATCWPRATRRWCCQARLVSDLLERIVSDDLYKAVLDEEMA